MRFSNLCIGLAGLAASVCHASADAAPTVAAPTVDPLARYVKSSGWVSYKGERFFVELMIDGDRAAIRMRSSRSPNLKQKIYGIESPGDALAVLADKRLAFVWPALTQWTGPGLALAKERHVRLRRAAWNSRTSDSAPANVSESTVSEPLKALLQLTDALENTGQG